MIRPHLQADLVGFVVCLDKSRRDLFACQRVALLNAHRHLELVASLLASAQHQCQHLPELHHPSVLHHRQHMLVQQHP
jgi:hypothetical protein